MVRLLRNWVNMVIGLNCRTEFLIFTMKGDCLSPNCTMQDVDQWQDRPNDVRDGRAPSEASRIVLRMEKFRVWDFYKAINTGIRPGTGNCGGRATGCGNVDQGSGR